MGRLCVCFWLGSSFVLVNHEVMKMWSMRGNKRKICQTAVMWKVPNVLAVFYAFVNVNKNY